MSKSKPSQESLKPALKEALTEVLQENRELLHEVFVEVIADFALSRAIHEERNSKAVTRESVFRTLRAK